MGSPEGELGRGDDETQRRVTITQGFWLGKHEVTKSQWEAVTGSNPSRFRGDDLPVVPVSWNEISGSGGFLERANCFAAGGVRFSLPTEAQWEYACRAGTTTALNSGKESTSVVGVCQNLNEVAWYWMTSGNETHPGGLKKANAWGLHDMHGNVCEWCADWYGDYPSGPTADPLGPDSGTNRVYRGGNWNGVAVFCRSAWRSANAPSTTSLGIGLRLARSSVP